MEEPTQLLKSLQWNSCCWRTAMPWAPNRNARNICIRTAVKMWQWYNLLKRNKQVSDIVQKRLMEKHCDDSRIMVFFLIERWKNSDFLHAQALAGMRQCSPCERYLLGQFCWAWIVRPQDQNTENKFCRRKDTTVLKTALHKSFHSLGEGRHVPRADNERKVLELQGAREGLLSGSWHWGELPSELPLELCRRHSVTHPGWQVPVVLHVHISNSLDAQASHFPKTSHKAR